MSSLQALKPVHFIYGALAAFSILLGVTFLLTGGYWHLVKIPLGLIVWQVYPPSLIIIGVFLMLLTRKYGSLALPLLVMGVGAFDTFSAFGLAFMKMDLGQLFFLQLILMVGGWLIAGRPRFRFHWTLIAWILSLGLSLTGVGGGYLEHLYEVLLYGYVFYGTVPRGATAGQPWRFRTEGSRGS